MLTVVGQEKVCGLQKNQTMPTILLLKQLKVRCLFGGEVLVLLVAIPMDNCISINMYDGAVLGDKITESSTYKSSTFKNESFDLGDYKGQVAIVLYSAAIDDVTYTQMEAVEGPGLTVKDGSTKITTGYNYNFGLATAGATKVFTLTNPGTENLTVAVSATGDDFTPTLSNTTITAGDEVTLTVTMPAATGSSAITITPAAKSGIAPVVINVSGTVRNMDKVFENFSGGLPDEWTNNSWTFTTTGAGDGTSGGGYAAQESYSTYTLITSQINFTEDETIMFLAKGKEGFSAGTVASYAKLKVYYTDDTDEWVQISDITNTNLALTWKSFETSGIPAGKRKIKFEGAYIYVTDIYGGEYPIEPRMVFSASDYDFGMISADAVTSSYTIENKGRATLTGLSVTSSDANFIVSSVPATIAAGESETFTITMKATVKGSHNATITVSADGGFSETFNVNGYVLDDDVLVITFDGNTVPNRWVNNGYEVTKNELSTGFYTRTLTSPAMTVAEGQKLAIYAKGGNTGSAMLTVKKSTDNGDTWTAAKEFTTELRASTDKYVVLVVDNIEAGNYKLQFEGKYVTINTLNGYSYNMNAPEISFTPEDFAAGKVTANASKTYTVTNAGTGTLTVNIASDNAKFTVSPATLNITSEPQDFTVTFNYAEGVYGKFDANITVTPTYDASAAVSFKASAQVVDPDSWEEDFEGGELPLGWVANNWTIGKYASYENKTNMALAPSRSTAGTIITPCLAAKKDQVLTWDAYLNWYDEALIVEYSDDDMASWTQIYNYKTQDDAEAPSTKQRNYHKEMSFTAPADGNYYLRFTSTYQNGVDNFSGFKLNLPEHIMAITASTIPTSGSYKPTMKRTKSFNATVTVKEMRGVAEDVTAKFYMGSEVIGTQAASLEANESKTITISCTPTVAAAEGIAMHIEVEYAGGTLATDNETRYVADLVLLDMTESEAPSIATGTPYDVITLTRSFAAGWNTFVAPLNVALSELGEGAKAYKFDSYAEGVLTFSTQSTTLNASIPYIVYLPAKLDDKVFTWTDASIGSAYVGNENITQTKNGVAFRGTYAPVAAGGWTKNADSDVIYGVTSEGKIAKAGATASIDGFRAYFDVPAAAARQLSIWLDDTTTGISTVMEADALNVDGIYNLQGQKVNKAEKGLYIVNGRKVVRK